MTAFNAPVNNTVETYNVVCYIQNNNSTESCEKITYPLDIYITFIIYVYILSF